MKTLKLCVIGNSVGLRVRPLSDEMQTYSKILESKLAEIDVFPTVLNFSQGRATVNEIYLNRDRYISTFPDYYIINLGVVDAATRAMPIWWSNLQNRSKYQKVRSLFIRLDKLIFRKNRAFFVRLRGKRPWKRLGKTQQVYTQIIKDLQKETSAKIILLELGKGTERLEKLIPGTLKNYKLYNEFINSCATEYDCSVVKVEHLEPKDFLPDGVHFSQKGHQYIANQIFDLLETS